MSTLILSNQDCIFGGYRIQNAINQLAMEHSADALDATTFGSGGNREFVGGLKTLGFTAAGFFQGTAMDQALKTSLGVNNTLITVLPQGATAGNEARFFQAVESQYTLGAQVGELLGFNLAAQNCDDAGLVSGTLMVNSATLAATGNGTGRQLGAIGATQKLYCAAHVVSVAGTSSPTITFTVQSDDNSGFTSATTRATLTGMTAIGAQWAEVAGPITDDYWRIGYTISGTNPVFSVIVSLGIQ